MAERPNFLHSQLSRIKSLVYPGALFFQKNQNKALTNYPHSDILIMADDSLNF